MEQKETQVQEFDNASLIETVRKMKEELDEYRAKEKAAQRLREMEELADRKAEEVAEAEKREKELQDEFFEKMFQEKLEQKRREKKIEFPVTLRAGNLSKADKQLLDIIKGQKALQYDAYGVKATLDTSMGQEWNPTDLANEIMRAKAALTKVRGALRVINMTTNPFKVPVRTGPADVSAPAEGSAITPNATDFVSNVTLTAYKLAANVPVSTEEGEDAIIAVLPEIRQAIAEGLARAEEEFFLNGTINNGATTVWGSGITGLAGVNKESGNATGTASTPQDFDAKMASALAAMGPYGVDPSELVMIVGIKAYFNLLYSNQNIQQISQYGDQAVLLTGEVGRYRGIPVLVSSGVRAVQDSGQQTYAENNLIINRNCVLLGDRRSLTIKSQDFIDSDITKIVGTERIAYNVPTALAQGVAVVKTHTT